MDEIPLDEVSYAIKDTVESSGRSIGPQALEAATRATQGYAFLIQLIGYHIWKQHPRSSEITLDDVEAGIRAAHYDMARTVLEPTLQVLTQREAEFLEAMLADEAGSNVREIAARMGVDANNAAQVRRRLVEQGVIVPVRRGQVAFAIPMMRDYLLGDQL